MFERFNDYRRKYYRCVALESWVFKTDQDVEIIVDKMYNTKDSFGNVLFDVTSKDDTTILALSIKQEEVEDMLWGLLRENKRKSPSYKEIDNAEVPQLIQWHTQLEDMEYKTPYDKSLIEAIENKIESIFGGDPEDTVVYYPKSVYPTINDVRMAKQEKLEEWFNGLPVPSNAEEKFISNKIWQRINDYEENDYYSNSYGGRHYHSPNNYVPYKFKYEDLLKCLGK